MNPRCTPGAIPVRNLLRFLLLFTLSTASLFSQSNDSAFRLQVLHFADADGDDLAALDNVTNLSALVQHFRQQFPDNTLLLSSGDNYIPGLRYEASAAYAMREVLGVPGRGRADIALLNALGVAASAVGNHELDEGPGAFVHAIRAAYDPDLATPYRGATFPYLSANIDFAAASITADLAAAAGQEISSVRGRLAPSAFVLLDGHRIGLVGAVTPDFVNITETGTLTIVPKDFDGRDEVSLDALAAELQGAVDVLTARNINKIILVSHMQQLAVDQALASRLRDVDIIIAGGSNSLLADADDRLAPGDNAVGPYPLVLQSATGDTILVVNTAGDYRYLGRLVVDFDTDGRIIQPLPLDDSYRGSYATVSNLPVGAEPIPEVVRIADALSLVIQDASFHRQVFGHSAVLLDGRRETVRTQETNLGSLIADANLDMARTVDSSTEIALVAGGGIRAGIAPGPISQLEIQNTLSFNSDLVLLTVSAAELATILEHAIAGIEPGATPGGFPQVSGLMVRYDTNRPGRPWRATTACGDGDSFGMVSRLRSLGIMTRGGGTPGRPWSLTGRLSAIQEGLFVW